MKNFTGIMQGRLSPRYNGRYQAFPLHTWQEEFGVAKNIGFDCLEFIFDYENFNNSPLMTRDGLYSIQSIVRESEVKVISVCADYFMKYPLFEADDKKRDINIEYLIRLIDNSSSINISDITLPFVDDSSLKTDKEINSFKESLSIFLPIAEKCRININLETDLPPDRFYKLISDIDSPNIKINYDIGNSASLGYNPEEELEIYGKYISVLHVKDRLYQGGSVKLGTGAANFKTVFTILKKHNFKGPIIMQAARDEDYNADLELVKEQFVFLNNCLERWFV